jgi:hypothetical protein
MLNVRYFIGFRMTSELRFAKEKLLSEGFVEAYFEENLYLGIFLENSNPKVSEIESVFEGVEDKLASRRLEIPKRLTPLKMIPQMMIG